MNNNETTESIVSTEVSDVSFPASSALVRGNKLPKQVPA